MNQSGRRRVFVAVGVSVGLVVAGAVFWASHRSGGGAGNAPSPHSAAGKGGWDRPVPVQVATIRQGEAEVSLPALGTVVARNTALVRTRVSGQLVRIAFQEGQWVRAGDVLAEIDPRPFQAQLDQALGQSARDEAQLANARVDLARYRSLQQQDAIARQQVESQEALVKQYEGTARNSRAAVDSARLQLEFAQIRAPFDGRLGLRQVDVGNLVQPGDVSGLVVLTQTRPVHVLFAIPADRLGAVLARYREGKILHVDLYDKLTPLARGRLVSIDNQVDVSTGTVKLKAEFANADERLFLNQSVNVRLQERRLTDVLLAPSAAIQRGAQGDFVALVAGDGRVSLQPVVPGPVSGEMVVIEKGLKAGDQVVIDGADKLRAGARVEISQPGAGKNASHEKRREGTPGGRP